MKLLYLIPTIFLSLLIFTSPANAFDFQSREDLNVDNAIADLTQSKLAAPARIRIVRVTTPNNSYTKDSKMWVQSLYYYHITRLGFLDIPFNYFIDRDGKIYQGNNGGEYTDPQTEVKSGDLVIGYLSNTPDISPFATTAFKDIVNTVSNKYGIERKRATVDTMYIKTLEQGISLTDFKKDDGEFGRNMNIILNTFRYSNKPNQKYIASVKSVKYPTQVKSSERFELEVTYENKNDFPWFTNSNLIYVSTKGSKESAFAVNGVWESFSKPTTLSDKVVMPGEEVTFKFPMQALLLPGKYSEKFNLLILPNLIFSGSEFTVNVNVAKGNFKLVKIVGIPSLNVRECIGPSCKIVTQVAQDQIFILEEKSVGWYKIKYADKKSGWVFGQYVAEL